MLMRAALLMIAMVAFSGSAVADKRGAGGSLKFSARGASEVEPVADDRVLATTGHVDLRALYGVRYALAADFGFEVGAELPGGFAYALRLQPIGGAIRFANRGWLGVVGGVGGSGVIDRVPIALELPVTAFIAFDLGNWVRVSSRLRSTWLPASDRRDDGSRAVDFADELDFEAGVAIGKRTVRSRGVFSDGTYLGVFVREQLSQRIVGVSVAIAISGFGEF